ncbi:MAG: hypothetical protein Q4A01_03945 [Coriobacteriales bacterium]|nr:hypothetical protein [Coriobacteriales bacterium]
MKRHVRVDVARLTARAFAVALVALALALVGCAPGGQAAKEAAEQEQAKAKEELPFAGREKRDSAELEEYVEKALKVGEERKDASEKDGEEAELTTEQAKAFADANEAYRKGDYAKAQKGYEDILESYSEHYGANVNLALALLQQEKNDEALVQALACMALFPKDTGSLLNVQAAAVACGFSAQNALDDAALVVVHKVRTGTNLATGMKGEREYNKLWDDIETQLYDVAQGKATNGEYVYQNLLDDVDELADGDLSNDEDVQALRAYLVAVGTQLGLEHGQTSQGEDKDTSNASDKDSSKKTEDSTTSNTDDKSKKESATKQKNDTEADAELEAAQTHVGLPYVVADDELCTIVFTGYHMAGDDPVAEFQFVNNSNGKLSFTAARNVTGNGKSIENLSAAWPSVEPGEQESAWGSFFGKDGDKVVSVLEGELTQLSCVASAGERSSSNKTTYPLKWEADPKQATKEVKQKLLDDENGVSLTVTKVLPASDGIVALEYSGTHQGGEKVLLDGSGWKVNGKEVELLGASSPMGMGSVGHHYLLFRAKSADDLRDGAVESLAGTLVLHDLNGKEVVNKQLDVSFK